MTMRAVVQKGKLQLAVEERPIPEIQADEILVKNVALGLNPTDWKHSQFMSPENAIMGCDCVGVIEKVGSSVTNLKKGDRRGIFLRGGMKQDNGAFSTYTKMPAKLTFGLPEKWSFEEAATTPCPAFTALTALYYRLAIPEPGQNSAENKWFLVYSASTSVGQYAVQIARASGFRVIATCSKERFDLIKSLGAEVVIDYKDSDLAQKIKDATDNSLEYAFDTHGLDGSAKTCHDALSDSKGGKLVNIVPQKAEDFTRKDVKQTTFIIYTGVGDGVTGGGWDCPKSDADVENFAYWAAKFPEFITKNNIKPLPIKKYEGIDKVPEALVELSKGVSATKLIVTV